MTHDYENYNPHKLKHDRARLEKQLDARMSDNVNFDVDSVMNRMMEAFRLPDPTKQLESLVAIQNELAAKATGVL